mmetsp:Transcript_26558/g.61152  ORF Transcript_26558/g.61152 Transcript_26558/m.61152 type:complete len:248 (-) Transcript_26558:1027-1770(-)
MNIKKSTGKKNSGPPPSKRKRTSGNSSAVGTSANSGVGLGSSRETEGKSKGLRYFSQKVCKRVEEKGHTSYNEVADELVDEFLAEFAGGSGFDEKNIRRRIYDALNVLEAVGIISKEKKEITWKGLPSSAHNDLEVLKRERNNRMTEIQRKRECLQKLLVQQVCFKNLVKRNKDREIQRHRDHSQGTAVDHRMTDQEKIPLPFIVVNTSSQAVVQCNMGPDRSDVLFTFSEPFEINDDIEILERMSL